MKLCQKSNIQRNQGERKIRKMNKKILIKIIETNESSRKGINVGKQNERKQEINEAFNRRDINCVRSLMVKPLS